MRNDYCSNYLEHSAKGTTWKNARYIAKVKLSSGKYFYFYDQQKYQNYLKRRSQVGNKKAEVELSKEPAKRVVSGSSNSGTSLNNYSSKSTAEKKAITGNLISSGKAAVSTLSGTATKDTIESGKTKAQELLERARAKGDSSSKKKGSGSSSSKSSKSKTGSSKSKGSSSSKQAKEKKESSGKGSSSKQAKEKTVKEAATKTTKSKLNKEQMGNRPFTQDSLKKLYGIKDEDVNKHESKEKLMEAIKSYKDGSFGYIMAGNKTYKWTKENGQIVFKDFDTDKEVALPTALNDIQEFRTDKSKKNKK